jgi:hypothetical protein
MGCIFTKEDYEDDRKELSLSSQLSISISELPYIEPIKTREQKQIENIQTIFREEYKRKKYNL